ncbi:uncharacterized protein AB675_1764 [Cyphellophora attinorum]|uniref:Heterokaryon incompatibility domain-containing protein n=1 Tax=Cyphellophora attinorum TaxID=1664694 RepID=A0A0N1HD27_9EURO|nr:uncharacterized protein AB675_1764 [Phialophora attinorum]KPI42792.1 hypothetical protein AB675_1764 [Phialophora attinorum]
MAAGAPLRDYHYVPLQDGEVRLIRILPFVVPTGPLPATWATVDVTNPVRLEFRHAPLDRSHTCLSYCWGSAEHLKEIFLNGHRFFIRDNLFQFLYEARRTGLTSWLWIDAICINQVDTDERNKQVQWMPYIFSRACEVLVWLNSGTIRPRSALTELDIITISGSETTAMVNQVRNPFSKLNDCLAVVPPLVDNNYFDRMWIISEIRLARSLHFLSFDVSCSLSAFRQLLKIYTSSAYLCGDACQNRCARIKNVNALLKRPSGSPARPLSQVIQSISGLGCECEDSRDRIYSILGLIQGGNTIQVDYSENLLGLYVRILPGQYIVESRRAEAITLGEYLGLNSIDIDEIYEYSRALLVDDLDDAASQTLWSVCDIRDFQHNGTTIGAFSCLETSWTHWLQKGDLLIGIELKFEYGQFIFKYGRFALELSRSSPGVEDAQHGL